VSGLDIKIFVCQGKSVLSIIFGRRSILNVMFCVELYCTCLFFFFVAIGYIVLKRSILQFDS